MDFKKKNIGIWGFGIVGKSLAKFLSKHTSSLHILEKNVSQQDHVLAQKLSAKLIVQDEQSIKTFFENSEVIFISAGIDTSAWENYRYKIISELDFFHYFFKKPIVAITGTIGKTTTTHLITSILKHNGFRVAMGGNIGVGLADFMLNQDEYDVAVVEVSSFQLEHCKFFAPTIAVWTNFFPNHLDRHVTVENYFNAKSMITRYQRPEQFLVAPENIIQMLSSTSKSQCVIAQENPPAQFPTTQSFFRRENELIYQSNNAAISVIPNLSTEHFTENVALAVAATYCFNPSLNYETIGSITLEHRMEFCGSQNSITFYNDSKATVPQATLSAINRLKDKSIILFLGGLSKGVDRSSLIEQLPSNIKHIICFGKEAQDLYKLSIQQNFCASFHDTLEQAWSYSLQLIQAHDAVLFSPAGSSYDLFKNYEERGNRFKELVRKWIDEQSPSQGTFRAKHNRKVL